MVDEIAFLLSGSDYYSCGTKPFVDLSRALVGLGVRVKFFALGMSPSLVSLIREKQPFATIHSATERKQLAALVEESRPPVLVSNDYVDTLELCLSLARSTESRVVAYVQTFSGINVLNERDRSAANRFASWLPWKVLTARYRRALSSCNRIVANSNASGFLLNSDYGIRPDAVMYPPVTVPANVGGSRERSGVFVYLGHAPDYFFRRLDREVSDLLEGGLGPVRCLGTGAVAEKIRRSGVPVSSRVSEDMLVRLYSESLLTYVPTGWEGFGYVGPESILCGTPVLLDSYQPWLELIDRDSTMVRIIPRNRRLRDVVGETTSSTRDHLSVVSTLRSRLAPETSARALLEVL